ncbi:MAG: transporter [Candidatus Cloacimonadota bacterium]|nr:MAG: transporter [Candidatus Cloacimonadota bacterium]
MKTSSLIFDAELTKNTVPKLNEKYKAKNALDGIETLDLSNVKKIDSAGVAFLDNLIIIGKKSNRSFELIGISKDIKQALDTFSSIDSAEGKMPEKEGFFESLGAGFIDSARASFDALILISEIFYWTIISFKDSKGQRKGSLIQQSVLIGVDALPIISLLSFILGLIMALQSAAQLRQFGANIFIADLIAISMVREMGPMMTAIILAGRSGSSIASEIATMKVTEELDALKMMAINPIRFVVVPKFTALTFCMPLLVMSSIVIGVTGGLIVAMSYLGLSYQSYFAECLKVLKISDFVVTMTKSVFFGWLIVIIGTFYGFQVEGGAEGVGKATTKSVVAAIFFVIIFDALFSLIYMVK